MQALPSLVRGLLTTYCLTSSSLDRLNSLRILLALLGPRRRGTVLSVSPGMSFSPERECEREQSIVPFPGQPEEKLTPVNDEH